MKWGTPRFTSPGAPDITGPDTRFTAGLLVLGGGLLGFALFFFLGGELGLVLAVRSLFLIFVGHGTRAFIWR